MSNLKVIFAVAAAAVLGTGAVVAAKKMSNKEEPKKEAQPEAEVEVVVTEAEVVVEDVADVEEVTPVEEVEITTVETTTTTESNETVENYLAEEQRKKERATKNRLLLANHKAVLAMLNAVVENMKLGVHNVQILDAMNIPLTSISVKEWLDEYKFNFEYTSTRDFIDNIDEYDKRFRKQLSDSAKTESNE